MSSATVVKVPHVQRQSPLSMWELIDVALGEGLCGRDNLCTAPNFPGLAGLGTKEREVWNGPSSASGCMREKGPT